jgi:hypothetical protein
MVTQTRQCLWYFKELKKSAELQRVLLLGRLANSRLLYSSDIRQSQFKVRVNKLNRIQ